MIIWFCFPNEHILFIQVLFYYQKWKFWMYTPLYQSKVLWCLHYSQILCYLASYIATLSAEGCLRCKGRKTFLLSCTFWEYREPAHSRLWSGVWFICGVWSGCSVPWSQNAIRGPCWPVELSSGCTVSLLVPALPQDPCLAWALTSASCVLNLCLMIFTRVLVISVLTSVLWILNSSSLYRCFMSAIFLLRAHVSRDSCNPSCLCLILCLGEALCLPVGPCGVFICSKKLQFLFWPVFSVASFFLEWPPSLLDSSLYSLMVSTTYRGIQLSYYLICSDLHLGIFLLSAFPWWVPDIPSPPELSVIWFPM